MYFLVTEMENTSKDLTEERQLEKFLLETRNSRKQNVNNKFEILKVKKIDKNESFLLNKYFFSLILNRIFSLGPQM